jgi:hypothetical protein
MMRTVSGSPAWFFRDLQEKVAEPGFFIRPLVVHS